MANGFTDEQEALVERVAWKIGEVLRVEFERRVGEKIEIHQANCSTTRRVNDALSRARGGWSAVAAVFAAIASIVALIVGILALKR